MDARNDPELERDLSRFLPTTARLVLHAGLDAAYRDAGRHFDPEAGSNMQLFGFTIFTFVVYQLRLAIEADPSLGLTVVNGAGGAFRLQAGPFLIGPYACGNRSPDDPWSQFPSNDKGAGWLAEINSGQMDLFAAPGDPHVGIVLGHYGNPEGGLEAVFLKQPIAQSGGRISRWGYVEPIYEIGSGGAEIAPEAPLPPVLPGPATVVRPKVLPFKKKPAVQDGETEGA